MRAGACAVLLAVVLLHLGCGGESYEKRAERENAARNEWLRQNKTRQEQAVAELAKLHEAHVEWSAKPFTWTADVQERMIRSDRRPIAGVAKLVDVERDTTGYLLHFLYSGRPLAPNLKLVLRATRPEAPELDMVEFGESFVGDSDPDYAFVARISRIRRDDVLISTGQGLDSRRRWIAEGECLDLRKLERPAPPPSSKSTNPRARQ